MLSGGAKYAALNLRKTHVGRKGTCKIIQDPGFSTFFSFLYNILRVVFCSYTLHTSQLSLLICKYRSPKCFFPYCH